MKIRETKTRHAGLLRLSIWPIVLLCLLCIALILWLVVRQRTVSINRRESRRIEKQESKAEVTHPAAPRSRVLTPTPSSSAVRTLSSESFRARYSPRVERREVESVLRTLEKARVDVDHRTASVPALPVEHAQLDVVIHDTTGDFVASTGQPWWAAAVTHDNLIELQPLEILRSRGVLNQTLRHEYAHTVIEFLSHGKAPRWLAEGLAAHIAGEGVFLGQEHSNERIPLDELERRLSQPQSAEDMRELYAAAYKEVSALIKAEGEASVWRRLADS